MREQIRYDERKESCYSSSDDIFLDAFPLPFQEVTKDDYGRQRQRSASAQCNKRSSQDLSPAVKRRKLATEKSGGSQQDPATPKIHDAVFLGTELPPVCSSAVPGAPASRSRQDGNYLSGDFVPGPWTVLIGRDKMSLDAPGTKRLHLIVGWYLESYAKSHQDKDEKSRIITSIESTVRSACGGQHVKGAFVKYKDGQWIEVESSIAREKIGRMLREALHTQYSSSSRRKRERRQHKDSGHRDQQIKASA